MGISTELTTLEDGEKWERDEVRLIIGTLLTQPPKKTGGGLKCKGEDT